MKTPPTTRRYRLQLTALSPVHVGDGRGRLQYDVDFVMQRGVVWVIDTEKLWQYLGERGADAWRDPDFRLSRLINVQRDAASLAAYSLPLAAGADPDIAQGLAGQTKDIFGRPYLPGSSIKGALRTQLLRAALGSRIDLAAIQASRSPRSAASALERREFGADPNHDLLRALRVFDSVPTGAESLRLVTAVVYSLRGTRLEQKREREGQRYRIGVEAVAPGTTFEAELSIDEGMVHEPALGFGGKADLLRALVRHSRAQAAVLIDHERRFYKEVGAPGPRQFYEGLARTTAELAEDECLLCLGWGTGWLGKTLGPALANAPGFAVVRERFRLGRPGAPFPKSRRLVDDGGRPGVPFGWARLRLSDW